MALAAYRHLLRGINVAFQNDLPLLASAQSQARRDFQSHRTLSAGAARERIQHAEQVAALLRHNIVQGERVGGTDGESERWQLKIHEETELGDNASVKMGAPGGEKGEEGACCRS